MAGNPDRLYNLLPALYREKDAEDAKEDEAVDERKRHRVVAVELEDDIGERQILLGIHWVSSH